MKQLPQPSITTGVYSALMVIGLTLLTLTTSLEASADDRRYDGYDSHRHNQQQFGHNKHYSGNKHQGHKAEQYYSNKHQGHKARPYYSNPKHGSYKGFYNGNGHHTHALNKHGLHTKKYDHRRYHHDTYRDRHSSHDSFSLNIWGFAPLVPHYRSYPSFSASYHYHNNNQRCYSRH